MSELEDLEDIAEATTFSAGGIIAVSRVGRPRSSHCSAGHERTPENSRVVKRGRTIRTYCRTCDAEPKAHKPPKVRYSARNYPL